MACKMEGKAMRTLHLSSSAVEPGLRWTARVLAGGLIVLILAIFIGNGGFNPFTLTRLEAIQMLWFWTTFFGLVAGWRWPVLGGALATGGMLLFLTIESWATGRITRLPVFYLMLLTGILFLVSGLIRKPRPAG